MATTIDDLKAQMEKAQADYAAAMKAETERTRAEAFTKITAHMGKITEAVSNRDAAAVVATVNDLSTFVKATFGSPRRAATSNGGARQAHDGPALRDLIKAYLAEHDGGHTAGTIGKALGRSSGAVSAAIERPETGLLATGDVTQTSAKPKMYSAV